MKLREQQAPLKQAYGEDPGTARVTLTASAGATEAAPTSCSVDIGRAVYEAQAHTGVGGAGTAACSGDLLLGALAACKQLTVQMVAAAMGLNVADIRVSVEGDLDLRGTLGITRDVPVGFTDIRVTVEVDGDLTEEESGSLQRKSDRYCVVLQTLRTPPGLHVNWRVGPSAAARRGPRTRS